MPKITRLEDLKVWQAANRMAVHIYSVTRDGLVARDFPMRNQLRRAALSVPGNIAEGFARGRDTEFHRYLEIARGSAVELKSHLRTAHDVGLLDRDAFVATYSMVDEVVAMIAGLQRYLRRSPAVRRLSPSFPSSTD